MKYEHNDGFSGYDLAPLRAHKFLNNRSILLILLPPTEDAFMLHTKRAALATIIDKSAHLRQPVLPPNFEEFSWDVVEDQYIPRKSTQPSWPQQMKKSIACRCTKGCNRNCTCSRKGVPCYIGCQCTGTVEKCSQARYMAQFDQESSSEEE